MCNTRGKIIKDLLDCVRVGHNERVVKAIGKSNLNQGTIVGCKEDGMVDALVEGVPLVVDDCVALTILDSGDREVNELVAVGLMV